MSLRFVIGASGAGKSQYVYGEIIQQSQQRTEDTYILLVPEQASLTVQQKLMGQHERHGTRNIVVLSFTRLAHRITSELGLQEKQLLDENGKAMILRRIVSEHRKELHCFGSNLERSGFFGELKQLVSEFLQCRVDEGVLEQLRSREGVPPLLERKLQDLEVIYQAFRQALREQYLTGEEQLELLAENIGRSDWLKRAHITVEGFNGFTPIQYHVLEELLKQVQDMTVVLNMRPELLDRQGTEYELFSMSRSVINRMADMAEKNHIKVVRPVMLAGTVRFGEALELGALEAGFDVYPAPVYKGTTDHLHLSVRRNPEEEVCFALQEILRLVREGYCYRDIAILTGDLNSFGPVIQYYFHKAELPVFLDNKADMTENPLVRFISSALRLVKDGFSYDAVFGLLKTGLVPMEAEKIERLENYVLALGIRGYSRWSQPWDRVYRGLDSSFLEEYNQVRQELMDVLGPFYEGVRGKDATVAERLRALESLLAAFDLEGRFCQLEKDFAEIGDYARAIEFGQVYGKLQELFSQLRGIMGNVSCTFDVFQDILEAGFGEMQVGILPAVMDRILVGDMRRTRLGDVKAVFLMGANEGYIPCVAETGGILTDAERSFFADQKVELAASAREKSFQQRYLLYLALTRASRELFISCSRLSGDGKALRPSALYGDLQRIFPEIVVSQQEYDGIITASTSLGYLADGLRRFKEGEEDPGWQEVYRWYRKDQDSQPLLKFLTDGAFYVYQQETLEQRDCLELYGTQPVNSVTRLEAFASCAYAHFLTYGLGLRERQQFELKAADFGNVYHNILELFFSKLDQESLELWELSDEKRRELVTDCVDQITAEYENTIFSSSARNQFLTEQIAAVADRTVWALGQQLRLGDFSPAGSELQFLPGDHLKSMQLMMQDGRSVSLAGRIDRIDLAFEEDKVFVRVIDYKSGSTAFDYGRLYYGLQLQLALYMRAALELVEKRYPDKQVIPAGIFYYNIQDPMIDGTEDTEKAWVDNERLKELRWNGLASRDQDAAAHQEHTRIKQSRLIKGIRYGDGGEMTGNSGGVTGEQLLRLCDYAREKAEKLCQDLYQGDVSVNPYEYKKWDSCTYCPYQSVCGFDSGISGYRKRRLKGFEPDDFWSVMKELEGREDANGDYMDRKSEKGH